MSDAETHRQLDDILRRLAHLEAVSRLPYVPSTPYAVTYLGGTTAGATTYTTQNGYWSRIGALVFFWGRVTWTAASGTGAAIISLPFTAATAASGTNRWSGSLWTNNVTFGTLPPQMLINQASAFFLMYTPANNAAATVINVEAAGDVIFSGFFPK